MKLRCNCCDGIYNSLDVHFTSACDNNCKHCIDKRFYGIGISRPNIDAIVKTIMNNKDGLDDILFLGGEPCLFLTDLIECIKELRNKTKLKLYVTTAVPKICHDERSKFVELINLLDGINLSVQHYDEGIADEIRNTKSRYDRQGFYSSLPCKEKIRINLNVVKPFLYTKQDLINCLSHYDAIGFNSIKLSEIQHGKEVYVSFTDVFELDMPSAYSEGCQSYLATRNIFQNFRTPVLLKRSCFLCEDSLKASFSDGIKLISKFFAKKKNKYGVIYEDGRIEKGWV